MPSLSPSPAKRPSITHRNSSTQSLSSSGKQATHKAHRPHVVGAGRGHGRNVSYGRNLSKLGKINSSANLAGEGRPSHQRKKSGNSTPSNSPKAALIKRNSSHVTLPNNTSHSNLRKNHSASALARNLSQQALKRPGLAPPPKQKDKEDTKTHDVFELGDQSSEEDEEEAEWEDSTTQSPELTRNNSKASTPARVVTPNDERPPQKPPEPHPLHAERTSSPPAPSLRNNNRSAPDLSRKPATTSAAHLTADPALLQHNSRSSRAPPAMSTISAHATPHLPRTNSSKSFTHISHSDANAPETLDTPNTSRVGASSSADGGVSHFLTGTTPNNVGTSADDGSDYDSPANFLPNYKPLASESPEKSRANHMPHVASRTQQRLELQRRETMRGGGAAPTTPPSAGIGFSLGSSASLHSRSGSRGRNRSLAGEAKVLRRDYEAATKQLSVVRRFRNPILESLGRLRDAGTMPHGTGAVTPAGATTKSRPQSRRGLNTGANGALKPVLSRSFEDKKPSPMASRSSSQGRGGRIQFARQGSHEDIALSRSKGSEEGDGEEEVDGMSKEEAMIRRIWETREVFDRPPSAMGRDVGEVR